MAAKRNIKVCSTGIRPGKDVNKQAVKAMRAIGRDLSDHKPVHISVHSDNKFNYLAKWICRISAKLNDIRALIRNHRLRIRLQILRSLTFGP